MKPEEKITTELFQAAKEAHVEASPYLKTRIMAAYREEQGRRRKQLWWQVSSLVTGAVLSAVLIFSFVLPNSATFEATTGKPYVVRVESLEKSTTEDFLVAQIVLPAGVYFHSKEFPELGEQRQLSLNWPQDGSQPFLPFVVKANESGVKSIKVKFFTGKGDFVKEKSINISFKEGQNV